MAECAAPSDRRARFLKIDYIEQIDEICTECGAVLSIGSWPYCPHGRPHGGTLLTAIHTSERAVIYRNPRTGEVRTPARADQPIPGVYARQGYVREELSTAQSIRDYEKSTGRLHEATHYHKGSGNAEKDLAHVDERKKDPALTHRLAEALR